MLVITYDKIPHESKIVREEVFLKEQGFKSDSDEIDDIATHFVAFESDKPVGACRVYKAEAKNTYILGRLSALSVCRGMGVGKLLTRKAEEYVLSIGGKTMILQAQFRVKDFYSKLGYKEYGDIEYEEGCALIWMKKELTSD